MIGFVVICSPPRFRRTMESIHLLIHHGANVNLKSTCEVGKTPFHLSIITCNHSANLMKPLMDHVDYITGCDNNGNTPLYYASTNVIIPAVTLLLSHPQIDVNKIDGKGNTPLELVHIGLCKGHEYYFHETDPVEDDDDDDDDDDEEEDEEDSYEYDNKRESLLEIADLIQNAMKRKKRNTINAHLVSSSSQHDEEQKQAPQNES
jgi:Ankyrin repeats (3 copies)